MSTLTLIHDGELVPAVDAGSLLAAAGIQSVRDAEIIDLAEFTDKADELRRITDEAKGAVSDEMVRRLDMAGRWTTYIGPYTIKSSSPTAGTVAYDVEKLRGVLADLVAGGVISAAGANGAVECVQPTAAVPYALLRAVLCALDGEAEQFDHEMAAQWVANLLDAEPEPTYKLRQAGVNALLKLGGEAAEAIKGCAIATDPGRRRAKVTRA